MQVFLYIDGDGIGHRLEGYVVDNDLEAAADLSRRIGRALCDMEQTLVASGAHIIFCGGDNLLAVAELDEFLFRRLLHQFKDSVGCSASAGVGRTATEAYLSLTVAKSMGGGHTVFWQEFRRESERKVAVQSSVNRQPRPDAVKRRAER